MKQGVEISFAEEVESCCEELIRLVEDTRDRVVKLAEEDLTNAVKLIANFETICLEKAEPSDPCKLCQEGGVMYIENYGMEMAIVEHPCSLLEAWPIPPKQTKYALRVTDDNTVIVGDHNETYGVPDVFIPVCSCPICGRSLKGETE